MPDAPATFEPDRICRPRYASEFAPITVEEHLRPDGGRDLVSTWMHASVCVHLPRCVGSSE